MKWIDVKNKLPKEGVYILVFCSKDITFNGAGPITITQYFDKYVFQSGGKNVTHWMNLPTAPKI